MKYRLLKPLPFHSPGETYSKVENADAYRADCCVRTPAAMNEVAAWTVEHSPDFFEKVEDAPPYPVPGDHPACVVAHIRRDFQDMTDRDEYENAENVLYAFFCQKKNDQAAGRRDDRCWTITADGLYYSITDGEVFDGCAVTKEQALALRTLVNLLVK